MFHPARMNDSVSPQGVRACPSSQACELVALSACRVLSFAAIAQLAEHGSSTSEVAGSTPVRRSTHFAPHFLSSRASASSCATSERTHRAISAATAALAQAASVLFGFVMAFIFLGALRVRARVR